MKESAVRLYTSLGSLLMIVASLYVYSSFISPEIAEVQRIRGEKHAQELLLGNYEGMIGETNRIIGKYESLAALRDIFSEALPLEEDIPSFLNQVYGLAELNNVLVGSIDFQYLPIQTAEAGSITKPIGSIRATVRCASDYENMKNFMSAIETNVRLMDIAAVDIGEGFKADPTLAYTLTVDTYYQTK